ncbi:MAG: phosphoribosylformylglycinamidine synthase subunit PurS [Defluviitaleaceae bacterium]|nr:phosphoribosylformylglycinamidine synthase subunit PurS [Defluviitaleaceae bacterium]
MFNAKIYVTLRESILDPAGKAAEATLQNLGYKGASKLRIGKYITMAVQADSLEAAAAQVDEICQKLLANNVMEDYSFDIE